jgi:predicted DNA-binding transcriptional regulator AlpA
MTREEVAYVSRRSLRTIFEWIKAGQFPAPSADGQWARKAVIAYLEGGIDRFNHPQRMRRLREGVR